ncbi:hypothetical protein [Methylocapsa sp. S129]|uniref:hypothetical protein n=1 Tax=Methylocapsa sp. S129 TaxID=1641869 RepID=UPI00131D9C86|nr:hypothetical protein [Methylocapsa sp. S129]
MVSIPLQQAVGLLAILSASYAHAAPIDLARWAADLPPRFSVHGVKTEPTYQEIVDIRREGDVFTLVGGAPAWAERSQQSIAVSHDGALRYVICPAGLSCGAAPIPTGFLATALLVSMVRRGQFHGAASTTMFGGRQIVCVPAERIGIARPLFDPCFDRLTGAVLAQRHRLTGRFDGPSLEPTSLRVAFNY